MPRDRKKTAGPEGPAEYDESSLSFGLGSVSERLVRSDSMTDDRRVVFFVVHWRVFVHVRLTFVLGERQCVP